MRTWSCFAPTVSCIVLPCRHAGASYGQSVEDMLRRAAERAAEKALRKAAPQETSQPPASPTPAWWRAASGMHRSIDGPRGEAIIDDAKDFCAATDGYTYVLTEGTVRRIDPKSGEVTTWLQ